MKVTTELKNLIKRSFDEKRAIVQKDAENVARKEYEEVLTEVANSKEFDAYIKAANAFYERFKGLNSNSYGDKCEPYYVYHLGDLKDIKPEHIVHENVKSYVRYNNELMAEVRAKVEELDLAQEALMIKLTYEKDLDKIREMLAEYDIKI
jgi:hypothetical protein